MSAHSATNAPSASKCAWSRWVPTSRVAAIEPRLTSPVASAATATVRVTHDAGFSSCATSAASRAAISCSVRVKKPLHAAIDWRSSVTNAPSTCELVCASPATCRLSVFLRSLYAR